MEAKERNAPSRLIVVVAFEDDGEGGMRPAIEPREYQSPLRARNDARDLAERYPAVIAWARDAKFDVGDYGEPEILFRHGEVPDME